MLMALPADGPALYLKSRDSIPVRSVGDGVGQGLAAGVEGGVVLEQRVGDAAESTVEADLGRRRRRAIFDQRCAVCHLSPEGQALNGPDLRAITDRSKEGLFSSILDPNQSVDPSYTGYTVTLANGSSLYGRILSENPNHLTLRLLDGSDHQLARHDIKSLTSSKLSLMPEGLEADLTHQQLADLINYLQNFRE